MRGLWSRELIGWVLALALLPIAAVVVIEQSVPGAGRMLAALVAVAFWQGVFRVWHGVPLSPSGVVIAVAIGVLAPMGLTPLQIALGAKVIDSTGLQAEDVVDRIVADVTAARTGR